MPPTRARRRALRVVSVAAIAATVVVGSFVPVLAQEPADDELTFFPYERDQELRHLLELVSLALDCEIQYEPDQVSGQVAVRPGREIGVDELWAIINRALAAKKLACVQPVRSSSLTVVPLDQAAGLARLETADLDDAKAGFLKAMLSVRFGDIQEATKAVELVLSRPTGAVTSLPESRALLVTDFAPNARQAAELVRVLDAPNVRPVIEEVRVENTSPVLLAAWIDQLVKTTTRVAAGKLPGELVASPESRSVFIVAPEDAVGEWRSLIQRFDRAEQAFTREYRPRRFGLNETASLVEEVVHAHGAMDPSSAWRLVRDGLTGTLIITTTPRKHDEIRELLARLESTEAAPGSAIRTFPIENRQVSEMLALLQGLLEAGALTPPQVPPDTSQPAQGATGALPGRSESVGPRVIGARSGAEVTLTADEPTNRIVAMGEGRLLDQLGGLIDSLDVRHAQVVIEAMIVSLSDIQSLDLGVELRRLGASNDVLYRLSSIFGLDALDPADSVVGPPGSAGFSGAVLDPGDFSAVIKALETLNRGRSLTVPKVLVNNNQEAVLESVVQNPFASTNASNTVATTSFGGTFDAGTSIVVKPQVTEGNHLVIDYTVSLSSFSGDSVDPSLPPPRQENRLQSIVTIPDGHTVVVGGLEVETETDATSQVPLLGDVPLFGRLFQSDSQTTTRTRFFVFLRATILREERFEDLKYLSRQDVIAAGVDDGWPELKPRIMR